MNRWRVAAAGWAKLFILHMKLILATSVLFSIFFFCQNVNYGSCPQSGLYHWLTCDLWVLPSDFAHFPPHWTSIHFFAVAALIHPLISHPSCITLGCKWSSDQGLPWQSLTLNRIRSDICEPSYHTNNTESKLPITRDLRAFFVAHPPWDTTWDPAVLTFRNREDMSRLCHLWCCLNTSPPVFVSLLLLWNCQHIFLNQLKCVD